MSQDSNVDCFSMCNCITVGYPGVYTAHGMTCSYFLQPIVQPGAELVVPHVDLWPSGYVRKYNIPKKINTFLFSSFNEAFNTSCLIDGGEDIRFCLGPHKGLKELKEKYVTTWLEKPTAVEWEHWLLAMNDKIGDIWGDVCKIQVIYDNRHAGPAVQSRMNRYDYITNKTLGWPVVKIQEPVLTQARWVHYSQEAHLGLQQQIKKITGRSNYKSPFSSLQ